MRLRADCISARLLAVVLQISDLAAGDVPQDEFAKYHRLVTGCDPAAGALTTAVDPSVSTNGCDAYRIVSTEKGVRITGSNDRSVLYGVYDLLERRGGCRWFWDGDVVPKRAAIDLSGLDVHEISGFEYRGIRYFAHRGLTRFQAEHWGPEDWTREIDWCLKKRLNVMMLRIGQDDLYQRAFPDVVPYPDPAHALPGHGRGYDNRSLFWPLDYRGRLRAKVQAYARSRGLQVPEDFGTMTHWYARTPQAFLDKMKPPFLPQNGGGYGEPSGLVWDVRQDTWAERYWQLTETALGAYGETDLLHTIGLGERNCFADRSKNLRLKIDVLLDFLDRAHRHRPNAKLLIAGWDFYNNWMPDEVPELIRRLDPKRDILWDYEADAVRYTGGVTNDFRKWSVIGRFPYTYSMFLTYESSLDLRANYPVIEERAKLIKDDPFCRGFILWPEAAHTDTLALEYFAANAWNRLSSPIESFLPAFAQARYGERLAAAYADVFARVQPIVRLRDWSGNCAYALTRTDGKAWPWEHGKFAVPSETWARELASAPGILSALSALELPDESARRDVIDLARTVLDRKLIFAWRTYLANVAAWRKGTADGRDLATEGARIVALTSCFADLLAEHTDYSLWESYLRLKDVAPVPNADFPHVLLENATCGYCRSHQYEFVRHGVLPYVRSVVADVNRRVKASDRRETFQQFDEKAFWSLSLRDLRPQAKCDTASLRHVLKAAVVNLCEVLGSGN